MFLKMQVVKATGSNIYKASIRHKTYDHIIVGAGKYFNYLQTNS